MPVGNPLPAPSALAAGVPAAVSVFFFANRPLTSLLPKAFAAEPNTEPAALLPAVFAAAVPAADPAAPEAELVAAVPAAAPASPTTLPLPALCWPWFFAEAQCSPPTAMRTNVLSG